MERAFTVRIVAERPTEKRRVELGRRFEVGRDQLMPEKRPVPGFAMRALLRSIVGDRHNAQEQARRGGARAQRLSGDR